MTRVLVVGGTGLLGQHIHAELRERGHEGVTLARRAGPGGTSIVGDVLRLSADEWLEMLSGFGGVVFAAGADDRRVPRAPADRYFLEGNVEPLRRLLPAARRAGCRSVVICGSYFTTMHRSYPQWRLAERHSYIRSRVNQAEYALGQADDQLAVSVLEIPFVFGSAEGCRPLWAPAVPWLRSRFPLLAPVGGTAVASAATVGQAAVGALERAAGGQFPVADANLTWRDLIARLAAAAGRREPVAVGRLPSVVVGAGLRGIGLGHRLAGREPGLDQAWLPSLLLSELFVDESVCRTELGVTGGDLEASFRDTIVASLKGGRGWAR
ncbi:MAG: NAD(P)-dependent oxidoreductase [Nocardiopsaceae bacterium]|nr:NAD(P)-dependent oxidoreductase [Nocardiopsaceae bacterium]